ncbi:putative helicase MOV-10 [Platysternon megacephalum]|uniref:Putative helicase MOV-10 n=1 Tax=Platysternon megacephalum TaxID=55544 RepID=A0A4D9E4S7_9SAUR|nr:putative helicase MOV-10 [Platysternon megacephalum]
MCICQLGHCGVQSFQHIRFSLSSICPILFPVLNTHPQTYNHNVNNVLNNSCNLRYSRTIHWPLLLSLPSFKSKPKHARTKVPDFTHFRGKYHSGWLCKGHLES